MENWGSPVHGIENMPSPCRIQPRNPPLTDTATYHQTGTHTNSTPVLNWRFEKMPASMAITRASVYVYNCIHKRYECTLYIPGAIKKAKTLDV